MQTQKMFHAMALCWATALSLAVVAACFAGPETESTGKPAAGNPSTTNTATADTTANDDTSGGITAGDYKQADALAAGELAAEGPKASEQPTNSADDARAVDQAVLQFYSSLNTLFKGDATAMEEIWSHAGDVTYMGPVGGYQIGWPQVQAVWEQQAALKLGGKVEPTSIHVNIGGDLASVQCIEVGNNVDADGQIEEVSIRATSLFRKEKGQWKMIGHHTDPLSYLENETEEEMSEE